MKIELFFELYCDNIPAKMQNNAAGQLHRLIVQQFVDFEITELKTFVTTFRFGFHLECMQKHEKCIKGPKCNAPQQAIEGFARKHNVLPKAMLVREEKNVKTFYIMQKVETIFHNNIMQILQGFSWPIAMRWNDTRQYWVRPIRNVLCIVNRKILPIEFAGIKSTNHTFTHNENPILMTNFADYLIKMRENKIFIDKKNHHDSIVEQMEKIATGFEIPEDFLEEIVGLSECTYCSPIDFSLDNFQELPMFAVEKLFLQQKCIFLSRQNKVIIFSNKFTNNDGLYIKNGYKNMLESKLEDLLFFYNQDRAKSLNDFIAHLDHLIFHKELGSMAQKAARVATLVRNIVDKNLVNLVIPHEYDRIVLLCKVDLSSAVVNEMPEVRGLIGSHYLRKLGVANEICDVVANHYEFDEGKFSNQNAKNLSLIINLADHLETALGFLAIGEVPTGSKDPLGIKGHLDHTIIYSMKLKIDFWPHVDCILDLFAQDLKFDAAKIKELFQELILERFIFNYFAHEERNFVLAILYHHMDFNFHKIHEEIYEILGQKSEIIDILPIYKRIKNLLKNKTENSPKKFNLIDEKYFVNRIEEQLTEIKVEVLTNDAEKELFLFLNSELTQLSRVDLLQKLHENRKIIDDFFDNCFINSDDPDEKVNRYSLVQVLRHLFVSVLNFDLL